MLSKVILLAATIALVASAVSAEPALAQPGNGKGHRNEATLSVSPNPASCCGATFHVEGSGFYPSKFAYVNVVTDSSLGATSYLTDASGGLSFDWVTGLPGTYAVKVLQYKHNKLVVMAETTVSVTP